MAVSILNSLAKDEDIDLTDKTYELVKTYIVSNHHDFKIPVVNLDNPEDDVKGVGRGFGIYDPTTSNYYIFNYILEGFLSSHGYPFHKIMREFAERKYIIPTYNEDGTIKTTSIQKKYKGRNIRFYCFPIKKAENIEESEEIKKKSINSNFHYLIMGTKIKYP